MTVQNNFNAIPVVSFANPPEGKKTARFAGQLTASVSFYAQAWQLNSAGNGLPMSQVQTLCVDNSNNGYPLQVIHGALNETVIVPSFSTVIVPTFSNASSYAVNVSALGNISPAVPMNFRLFLLNYTRSAGTFSGVLSTSLTGTGQNTLPLFSGVVDSTTSDLQLLNGGDYIFDSIDVAIEGAQAFNAGNAVMGWTLSFIDLSQFPVVVRELVTGEFVFVFGAANQWVQGSVCKPIHQTSFNGIITTGGVGLFATFADPSSSNVLRALMRVNISGNLV